MILLLATSNPGKVRELTALLSDGSWEFTTPAQQGLQISVAETGRSLEENAALKARAFAIASGLVTVADDSGLEVEALGGEPGPLSARYAGDAASDEVRVAYLLHKLDGVAWAERKARFRCVIAIGMPDGDVELYEGECLGIIALEPRGDNGFGYDPVFYLPDLGKTMAELGLQQKNTLSHRSRAARRARQRLHTLCQENNRKTKWG